MGESRAERLELKVTDFGSWNVGCGKFEEGNYLQITYLEVQGSAQPLG